MKGKRFPNGKSVLEPGVELRYPELQFTESYELPGLEGTAGDGGVGRSIFS